MLENSDCGFNLRSYCFCHWEVYGKHTDHQREDMKPKEKETLIKKLNITGLFSVKESG